MRTVGACADVRGVHVQHAAQAKVCDFAAEAARVARAALEQDVGSLEVSVHDAN
jgi:hypothetical protein